MRRIVINIESDKHRRSRTELELKNHGYDDFVFMNAITDKYPKKGISMSFRKAIIENYDQEYLHIFEDDVKLVDDNSKEYFDGVLKILPDEWDIFLGGSYEFKTDYKTKGYIKVLDFSSLHSVVIRKKAYDKVLAHDYSIMEDIDRYLGYLSKNKKLNVFLCDPQVAVQYPGFSYNRGKEVDYTNKLKDKNLLHEHSS